MTIRAILFDIDDTLLENNFDRFLEAYFALLIPHFAHLIAPDRFVAALFAATQTMIARSDVSVTNQQAFMADFFQRVGLPAESLMPLFENFYANRFHELRSHTRPNAAARDTVQAAFAAGCDVVIATNPIFPETAIRQRLAWADVDGFPFKLITSYERMHAAKPNVSYYEEIAHCIGRKPEECVMVGDDWGNDIVPAFENRNAGLLDQHNV